MERFPSTALKEGARGVTMLYRSPVPIASRNFMVNGIPVMQVLADGRQTVLPPTIHPDTNRPYTWGSKFTLYNTHVNELPLLPAN